MKYSKLSLLLILALATITALGQLGHERKVNGHILADLEPASERTSFSNNGPQGRWSAAIIADMTQTAQNAPVVIEGTHTLMGNAEWRNLKLTSVTLKNFSSKTVLAAQIEWFVTTKADRTRMLPPPGYTGLFEARLLPGEMRKVECPIIEFSKIASRLARNGSLEGDFLVQIRISDVEFADGTNWDDAWNGPTPGRAQNNSSPMWLAKASYATASHACLSCPNTLCSYNTPDYRARCETDLVPGQRCELGDPCSADGRYCTCNVVRCNIFDQ